MIEEYQKQFWFIMTGVILFCLVFGVLFANAYTDEDLANAIYLAEGGKGYNYGIKSVKFKDEADAQRICLNTIKNQRKRHALHNCGRDYLTCLWFRYCPPTAHKLNKNWLKNVRYFLNKTLDNKSG